jgi:hypothetical protein
MNLAGTVALITGASRGLGRALAFELAARGARIALHARASAHLAATLADLERRGAAARAYPFDLHAYRESAALLARVEAELGAVDLLVLTAATGTAGEIADLPLDAVEENVAVNFLAPAALTGEFLRRRAPERSAAVCFVLSGAALRALPAFAAYSTGKAALASFADALRIELRGTPVQVLSVFPGTMDTEFTVRMPRVGRAANVVGARRKAAPEAVARRIVRAIEGGAPRLFLWGPARILYHVDHVLPGLVDLVLARLHARQTRGD